MERLVDMELGIDKYFSFVVLESPIIKAYLPLKSLFPAEPHRRAKARTSSGSCSRLSSQPGSSFGTDE